MATSQPNKKIVEIKHKLDGPTQTFACNLLQQDLKQCLVSHTLDTERLLDSVPLPIQTLTLGYFWKDRPYNLYHFISATISHNESASNKSAQNKNAHGTTLAYYFNICDQIRWDREKLQWRDLVIDVIVTPKAAAKILDWEQLPTNLPTSLQQYIDTATDHVMQNYREIISAADARSAYWVRLLQTIRR